MATRLYLPATGTPPLVALAVDTNWELTNNLVRLPTKTARSDTALATVTWTWPAALTQQWCWWQFQSFHLAAAYSWLATDTVSMVVGKCAETSNSGNAHLAYVVRVVSGDGSVIRGVIGLYHATSTEFPLIASAATRIHNARTNGATAFSSQVGDRIIVEIGLHGVSPALEAIQMRKGDPIASPPADFALTAGLTTDLVSWVELSRTVAFGQTVAVGQVAETDSPQIILWRPKNRAAKQTAETDSVQAVTRVKYKAIGIQAEAESVFSIVPHKIKNISVGQVGETDLSQAIGKLKQLLIGQLAGTDSSQVIVPAKIRRVNIVQVEETELAQSLFPNKKVSVVQVVETDLSHIVGRLKSRAVAQTTEEDGNQSLSVLKRLLIGQTAEIGLSQAISSLKQKILAQVIETSLSQIVAVLKVRQVGQVLEVDLAFEITSPVGEEQVILIGQIVEIDTAHNITSQRVFRVSQVLEENIAQAIAWSPKNRFINYAVERDLAQRILLFMPKPVVQEVFSSGRLKKNPAWEDEEEWIIL
jgi:hypothetical protein